MPFAACDAVARLNVSSTGTTTTGTAVSVAPSWINFAGGDSFYSLTVSGGVVYVGGHNRWVNNQCGNNTACEPNALLVNGVAALDASTGLGLPWWHPQTTRGFGTMYLSTFTAGTYDGTHPGLILGTDGDVVGGAHHGENAVFPMAPATSATPGGPIPEQAWPLPAAQGPPSPPATGPVWSEEEQSSSQVPCLDDTGDSTATGNPAQMYQCRGNGEQQWTATAPGTVQLTGTSDCLDTASGGTTQATQVVLDPCNGSSSQVWTPGSNNLLVQQASGLCLDDPGFATANGQALQIWSCNGGGNQGWQLPKV